jgi:Uma2 family endonuclease
MSVEEYLEQEATSIEKHEYVAGRIFAMVGASEAHNAIVSNLHRYLYDAVKEADCRIYVGDMKVRVEASQSFYYPDLVVTCEPFSARSVFKSAPRLIIEVLSPSTMEIDRREKLIAYRQLTSLAEYVVVYQDKRRIETYHKDENGQWLCDLSSNDEIVTVSISANKSVTLRMDDIYFGIELDG